jgi:hypothetical protein
MKTSLSIGVVFGWLTAVACGYPVIPAIPTDQLMAAPVMVIGQMEGPPAKTGRGVMADPRGGKGEIAADVYELGIEVEQTIKGAPPHEIKVVGLMTPVERIEGPSSGNEEYRQFPSGNRSVFFLAPGTNAAVYVPVSHREFAIEIERDSGGTTASPVETLRAIAKANVETANYPLAVRWAAFLGGLHDDSPYWTQKTLDARILIRATAYDTLVQNFPGTPGLRAEVIQCLSAANPPGNDSDVWMAGIQLITPLSKLFDQAPPRADEIRSLLGSHHPFVLRKALSLVRDASDLQLLAAVENLLATSQDRDIQYECIKTLYGLSGDPHLIAYPTFLAKPDQYINQWRDWRPAHKNL